MHKHIILEFSTCTCIWVYVKVFVYMSPPSAMQIQSITTYCLAVAGFLSLTVWSRSCLNFLQGLVTRLADNKSSVNHNIDTI